MASAVAAADAIMVRSFRACQNAPIVAAPSARTQRGHGTVQRHRLAVEHVLEIHQSKPYSSAPAGSGIGVEVCAGACLCSWFLGGSLSMASELSKSKSSDRLSPP